MAFVYGSTFRLDDRGEVVITHGNDLSLVTEYEKLKQDLSVILHSQKYQYIFDLNFGVDYQTYLTDTGTTYFLNRDIATALESYYFVKRVNSVNSNRVGNVLQINADLTLENAENVIINLEI